MQRVLATLFVGISVSACGGSSSAPPTPSVMVTKIMALSGDLAFGRTQVGKTVTRALKIANDGSGLLTVSGVTLPTGYSANWTSGTIEAGRSQNVGITFAPTTVQGYDGPLTVNSDQTVGGNAIFLSGTGVAPTANVPVIISPVNGAVLPNSAPGSRPIWTFTWSGVAGTLTYRLNVKRAGAAFPAVDVPGIAATTYDYQTIGDVTPANLLDWQWMVQSDEGWSETGTFNVAPGATLPLALHVAMFRFLRPGKMLANARGF